MMDVSKRDKAVDQVFYGDHEDQWRLRGDLGYLLSQVGERYWECTLDNYKAKPGKQEEFKETVKNYAENIKTAREKGIGFVMFGSRGCGKDHMACHIAKQAIRSGFSVEWINGVTFRGKVRDLIGSSLSEKDFVDQYIKPDFLWFSDPFTAGEPMTSYQKEFLLRVIDARYQKRKPIIWTCNASTKKEFEDAVGAAAFDRMRADAVRCFCNWESFRKPRI